MTDEQDALRQGLREYLSLTMGEVSGEQALAREESIDQALQRYVTVMDSLPTEDQPPDAPPEPPDRPWSPSGPVDTSLDPDEPSVALEPGLVSSGVHADPRLLEILGFIPEAPSLVADRPGPTSVLGQREADLAAMPEEPPEPPSLPSPRVHPSPPDDSTTYIEAGAPTDRPIFRNGRWITPRERGIR